MNGVVRGIIIASLFLFPIVEAAAQASAFWLKVYGAGGAVANMTFGNRAGNTTTGQDTGMSFPVEYREQEAPPPSPGFDAIWAPVRPNQFGSHVRGLLDRQFNEYTSETQIDTFKVKFAQGDNSAQPISFKWPDCNFLYNRSDSMILVEPTGHIPRINMFDKDSLYINAAGDSGISELFIIKYGIFCFAIDGCESGRSCVLGADDSKTNLPASTGIDQNYPNPFNPETEIRYALSNTQFVSLKIYDVLGKEVAILVNGIQDPGSKSVGWDASGKPSGIYFYRLQAGAFIEVRKMILVR